MSKADDILAGLGGADNIVEIEPCITRLRTEVKEGFRALREQLSPHDRMLLQLKVEQDLPWTDVAEILWDEPAPPTREALEKRAASLRQQFKRLKERLKALAIESGLINPEEPTGTAAH